MYDYRENIKSDILDYIQENYTDEEIRAELSDRDEWEQRLYDDLFVADSVTGNASGSYYCNTYRAAEAISHNWDFLNDALLEFGCTDCNPIEKGEEWCDVTIRCYLLGECLSAALDELEESEGQTMYETTAKQLIESIKLIAAKPDNLDNLECYLSRHFPEWLTKRANTPETLVSELRNFAEMEI